MEQHLKSPGSEENGFKNVDFSLGAGGQVGVERLLHNMQAEIRRNMILMGCKNLSELNQDKIIYRR